MWMAYAQQHWPKAVNIQTAVERLQCEFEARGWDVMLNINRLGGTIEELQQLRELEDKYFGVVHKCEQFLQKSIDIQILKQYLKDVELSHCISDIEKFVH